jgi:hypothetical protein
MSVEELQEILSQTIPGWNTHRIGDLDDPENVRTPATVLDSLLHAYGEPPELNILSQEELAPLMYPFDKPRAHYYSPVKHQWTVNPLEAEYEPDVWWKSTFNPIGYLGEKVRGGQTGRIYASTLHDIIEEITHDVQYKDPQYKAARGEQDKYVDAGDATHSHVPYETPGTLEYEAHSSIGPLLWNLLTRMKTSDRPAKIGTWGDLGTDKYPYRAIYEYANDVYGWPIKSYKYKPLIEDGQNQSERIQSDSLVRQLLQGVRN